MRRILSRPRDEEARYPVAWSQFWTFARTTTKGMERTALKGKAMSDLPILQIIAAVLALGIGLGVYFWTARSDDI